MIPGQKKGEMVTSKPSAEKAITNFKQLVGKTELSSKAVRTLKAEIMDYDAGNLIDNVRDSLYDLYKRLFGIPDDITSQEYAEAVERYNYRQDLGLEPLKKDDAIIYLYNRQVLESRFEHLEDRETKYRRWELDKERRQRIEREEEWKKLMDEEDDR